MKYNQNNTIRAAFLFFILTLFQAAPAPAQEIVVNRLSAGDGPGGAKITVTEKGDAASIVRMASSTKRPSRISGYRVRIFFDNKQDARSQAYGAKSRFESLFPGIPVDLKYDIPDFKVTVGNCLTNEEAIILWGRIKGHFPKAFLIPEEIPLDAFAVFTPVDGGEQDTEPAPGN